MYLQGKNLPISEQYRKVLLDRVITLESESKTKPEDNSIGSLAGKFV